jgi:hypothetical protein
MNAFQIIDAVAKKGLVWEVTDWCLSIRTVSETPFSGRCPLQVFVNSDQDFKTTIGVLRNLGVSWDTIRLVQQAADGTLHRDAAQVMQYRRYMIRSFKFTEAAQQALKRGWRDAVSVKRA